MGIVYDGDGDINFTGVVGGSSGKFNDVWDDHLAAGVDWTNTEIQHYGEGEVWVNDRRYETDADGA